MAASTETRFAFGENWRRFLSNIDARRITTAVASMADMMQISTLAGLSFLDIGCGSGLFSLAAGRLGAAVRSFDYDHQAVACARQLKAAHLPEANWTVERGDVLDAAYIASLGQHDIVYSWGVLHHTGAMWRACENAASAVKPGGLLYIAIYNDQGYTSRVWWGVKWLYNVLPSALRPLVLLPSFARLWGPSTARDFLKGKPFATWRGYQSARGMSPWTDVVDWVGGFPFEVASREQITEFFKVRGFALHNLRSAGSGLGCNEFVFRKAGA